MQPHMCFYLLVVVSGALVACATQEGKPSRPAQLFVVDDIGRQVDVLEIGSSLLVAAHGLEPYQSYEVYLVDSKESRPDPEKAISYARLKANGAGKIRPFILWYNTGVVGCDETRKPRKYQYRSFQEAERALADMRLTLNIYTVSRRGDSIHRSPKPITSADVPIVSRTSPMIYPALRDGCMASSRQVRIDRVFISGFNFKPSERLEVLVVPNQTSWDVGDALHDVTGREASDEAMLVTCDRRGTFTAGVWNPETQVPGAYDIVVRRGKVNPDDERALRAGDIVSFPMEAGFVVFQPILPGGATIDIAGRPLQENPYISDLTWPHFRFSDGFAAMNDTVYAALDPIYFSPNHQVGPYATIWIVPHRDLSGWNLTVGASNPIQPNNDPSGDLPEIVPIKCCCYVSPFPIWHGPLQRGDWDVVIDFGDDQSFDPGVDFLDGADRVGFTVTEDPYTNQFFPRVQCTEYSEDDVYNLPYEDQVFHVDMRAMVCYPVVSLVSGWVAPGQHPLFLMQHGEFAHCASGQESHETCTDRLPSHKGYMRLLRNLARKGIIAVSIDAYDLQNRGSGMFEAWSLTDERGELFLKHLEYWTHQNDPAEYPLYATHPGLDFGGAFIGHVDLSRISIAGHSRGAEAAISAYLQNQQNPRFNIGSVAGIAPPDTESFTLDGVPYFVIVPAADGDVPINHGVQIYDRIDDATNEKSGIYVYGANHWWFNSIWAQGVPWLWDPSDPDPNDESDPNRNDKIPLADQLRIGQSYLAAFARIHLKDETIYKGMLQGTLTFPSVDGFKIQHFYQHPEHLKLENGFDNGVQPGQVSFYVDGQVWPSTHHGPALEVRWWEPNKYLEYEVNADVSSYDAVSMRVAWTDWVGNPSWNGYQWFQMELVSGGQVGYVNLFNFGLIPDTYKHPKIVLYPTMDPYIVMSTIRIPLHSFIMNNSGVDLTAVDTLRFYILYPNVGELYIDDLEFTN